MYTKPIILSKPADLYLKRSISNYKKRAAQLKGRFLLLAIIISLLLVSSGLFGNFIAKAQSSDTVTQYKYYTHITISYGESLWSIAEENMGTEYNSEQAYIKEVIQINNLDDADSIMAGQTIVIPYYSSEFK